MAGNRTEVVAAPGEPTIVVRRAFDAPRRLVFDAWTRPEHVSRWWGMHGTTLPVCEIDLRPGGAWRYVVRDPAGNEYPFRGEYREIARPERLVHTFVFDVEGIRDRPALVTVLFEERLGRTTVTETTVHQSVADRDGHLQAGMEEGASQTFDRLDALLPALA